MPSGRRDYTIRAVMHASEILRAFREPGETLRLCDVMERTGLAKGMCFRLIHTLRYCGFLERIDRRRYRLPATFRPRYRIGYGAQGQDSSFAREVHDSLLRAAAREGVDIIVADNRYQPKVALRNADLLIRENVDLVIEFQTNDSVAPAIAAKYREAHIPLIAIDIPHPQATYFGANNFEAGLLAGHYLARYAQRWNGRVDEVLLLEIGRAGSLPAARMKGVLAGIREADPATAAWSVVSIDADGQFKTALQRVRQHLRGSKARRVLVGAANDPSALGAARAFQEAGRAGACAIVGQNAEPDARAELRQPGTPLVASVGYFPERYGDGLIRLALDILGRRAVPPAVFTRHQIITRDNVDVFYGEDARRGLETYARF
jgi:ribose transport system substrate-binding protein